MLFSGTTMQDPLLTLDTPAAVIDLARMQRNIDRMQQRMDALGVRLRPHVKTSKSVPVAAAQRAAGASGITVSTLKEAEQFFAAGTTDILYAVSMAPHRLPQALQLRQRGCDLKLIVDSVEAARAIAVFGQEQGEAFEVWIEIDTDGHRSGVQAGDTPLLLAIGRALHEGGMRLGGVLTHAGSSYELDTPEALQALAERERAGCVQAAQALRAAGLPCPVVSVGSTPTALAATGLDGVTEVRRNIGVCTAEDVALSVLATVIGHQADKGWAIVDAGWMAMSRDRGTAKQRQDFGYGQVCDLQGEVLPGFVLTGANQEHGILARADGTAEADIATRFPLGTRLRILPNHACATGAQFPAYQALAQDGSVQTWERLHGW
jgi:D-serine deaminase-like pyridoxal phosphate-dependent protein